MIFLFSIGLGKLAKQFDFAVFSYHAPTIELAMTATGALDVSIAADMASKYSHRTCFAFFIVAPGPYLRRPLRPDGR
jgi:hypothetical protein